jgi:hypothetical protein
MKVSPKSTIRWQRLRRWFRSNPSGLRRSEAERKNSAGRKPWDEAIVERLFDCNIVSSLEVYDDHAVKTRLDRTDAKPLAPPTTPAQ